MGLTAEKVVGHEYRVEWKLSSSSIWTNPPIKLLVTVCPQKGLDVASLLVTVLAQVKTKLALSNPACTSPVFGAVQSFEGLVTPNVYTGNPSLSYDLRTSYVGTIKTPRNSSI